MTKKFKFYTRVCNRCGDKFQTKVKRSHVCDKCQHGSENVTFCEVCGKQFIKNIDNICYMCNLKKELFNK